jgi:hypothetical protein
VIRLFLAPLGALAVIFALASPALGATRTSSVGVTAPATARADRSVKLLFRGFAARPANELVVYLDDRACASAGRTEGKRSEVRPPTLIKGLSKSFAAKVTVLRTVSGTHYVCGYLENQRSGRTYAHTSGRYLTR